MLPADRAAKAGGQRGVGFQGKNGLFHCLVAADGIDALVPRSGVVEAVGPDLAGHAVVIDFSDAAGPPAVAAEELRHRDRVGQHLAEIRRRGVDAQRVAGVAGGVGQDVRRVGPHRRHERRAAGTAHGILAVGALEPDAALREPVDVRGFHGRIAVAAEIGVQIVGDDEEDVEFCRLRRGAGGDGMQHEREEGQEETWHGGSGFSRGGKGRG